MLKWKDGHIQITFKDDQSRAEACRVGYELAARVGGSELEMDKIVTCCKLMHEILTFKFRLKDEYVKNAMAAVGSSIRRGVLTREDIPWLSEYIPNFIFRSSSLLNISPRYFLKASENREILTMTILPLLLESLNSDY